MNLNEDVLRELCATTALLHPPHWQQKGPDQPHGWKPQLRGPNLAGIHSGPLPATYCLGWIYLSHVNHRLRQICLDSPTLWADVILSIPSASTTVMETMLARAGQVPLNLFITTSAARRKVFPPSTTHEEYRAKVTFVAENLDRAAVCSVDSRSIESDIDWAPVFDGRPLLNLRYLTLFQRTNTLQRVLSLTAPNLVKLCLGGCLFPSSTTAMVSLRRLYMNIDENKVDSTTVIVGNSILSILRCAPALEELDLIVYFRQTPVPNVELLRENVKLAHLRKAAVQITGPFENHILRSRIEAPEATKLQLYLDGDDARVDPSIALRSMRLQLACPAYCTIKLVEKDYSLALTIAPLNDGVDGGVLLHWQPMSIHLVEDIFNALPQFVVASNITRLHFVGLTVTEDDTALSDSLRGLPAVTDLIFENGMLVIRPGAIDEWFNYVHPLRSLALAPSILPALHTLELSYDNGPPGRLFHPEFYRMHWETVGALLQTRAAAGNPVRVVKLFGYRAAGEDAAALDAKTINGVSEYVQEIVDARSSH